MTTLNLTLKKKWFDMIKSGEKKEEYREIKQYWVVRLIELSKPFEIPQFCVKYNKLSSAYNYSVGYKGTRVGAAQYLLDIAAAFKEYTHIKFTHGYSANAPTITVECLGISIGTAKPEWSDNWQGQVFVIKLGKIINPELLK